MVGDTRDRATAEMPLTEIVVWLLMCVVAVAQQGFNATEVSTWGLCETRQTKR